MPIVTTDNKTTTQSSKPAKPQALTAVKGMNDLLPPASAQWEWLEEKVRGLMARHAYRNLRTPIVEPTALFVRGLGEVTDIVEKEMYSFEDRLNGEQLTLRPEATAGSSGARWWWEYELGSPRCHLLHQPYQQSKWWRRLREIWYRYVADDGFA